MYFKKTPFFLRLLYPNAIWDLPSEDPVLYLTFDDGPVPEVTPLILDMLAEYNAKATFFCVGENLLKHPEIARRALSEGHRLGNHTMNHLNGWKTSLRNYINNVESVPLKTDLFRPPYGKMSPFQYLRLRKNYKVVLWDVLSTDFDPNQSIEDCVMAVKKNAGKGSVIVFHDSVKARERVLGSLPVILSWYHSKGYKFKTIGEGGNDELEEMDVAGIDPVTY